MSGFFDEATKSSLVGNKRQFSSMMELVMVQLVRECIDHGIDWQRCCSDRSERGIRQETGI